MVVRSTVNSLFRYTLVRKVNSKTTWVYRANLVEYVRYKARDPIKFEGGKEPISFDVV